MTTPRRWYPTDADYRRIWEHLQRQRGVDRDHVRLDDGTVVRVGSDAAGEGGAPPRRSEPGLLGRKQTS